jgi:hypothetical protein
LCRPFSIPWRSGTAAFLLLDITVPPRQDTFRWEVAIRDAPPPEPIAAEVPSPLSSADAPSPLIEDLSPTEWEALHTEPRPSFDEIDVGTSTITAPLHSGRLWNVYPFQSDWKDSAAAADCVRGHVFLDSFVYSVSGSVHTAAA